MQHINRLQDNPTRDEAKAWMKEVIEYIGHVYHPDTLSSEYDPPIEGDDAVNLDDGNERMYTQFGDDVYDIGLELFGLDNIVERTIEHAGRETVSWYGPDLEYVPDNIGTRKLTELSVTLTRNELKNSEHVSFTLNYAHPPFNGEAFSMTDWVDANLQDLFNDESIEDVKFRANECYIRYKHGTLTDTENLNDLLRFLSEISEENLENGGRALIPTIRDDAVSIVPSK